jgi:hypothetical protein
MTGPAHLAMVHRCVREDAPEPCFEAVRCGVWQC